MTDKAAYHVHYLRKKQILMKAILTEAMPARGCIGFTEEILTDEAEHITACYRNIVHNQIYLIDPNKLHKVPLSLFLGYGCE